MITDQQPPAFSPEDLRKNFERLQSELQLIQSELEQALSVWRAILVTEKQDFQKLLEEREKTWAEEETQWQNDRRAHQSKIHELETYFKDQLKSTEQKAITALNELDAAWQQERARWQDTASHPATEFQQAETARVEAQRKTEQRLTELEEENAQLRVRAEQVAPLENQISEWQKEKISWQEALTERANELQQAKESWAHEQQLKAYELNALRQQIAALEHQHSEIDETQKSQDQHVRVYMNTLETQVSALQDFVQQVFQPPRRRRSDANSDMPPVMFRPPTPRVES